MNRSGERIKARDIAVALAPEIMFLAESHSLVKVAEILRTSESTVRKTMLPIARENARPEEIENLRALFREKSLPTSARLFAQYRPAELLFMSETRSSYELAALLTEKGLRTSAWTVRNTLIPLARKSPFFDEKEVGKLREQNRKEDEKILRDLSKKALAALGVDEAYN